jgi:two-component system cell cycle response regulator
MPHAAPDAAPSVSIDPRIGDVPPWVILSVDDDELIHMVTRRALRDLRFEGRGMHVLAAESAAEARDKLTRRADISLILLDVAMESQQAGLDLLRQLREQPQHRLTRIILRTGKRDLVSPLEMVARYEIDGYYFKGDHSLDALQLLVLTSLRTARLLQDLERSNDALSRATNRVV